MNTFIEEEEALLIKEREEQDRLQEEYETLMKGFEEYQDERALERIRARKGSQDA